MQFFHVAPFRNAPKPSIAAIGNFDGLHLGHQALLTELLILAKQKNLTSTVILFEPQPLEFFQKNQASPRLQTLSEKLHFLQKFGVEQVICIRFDEKFAALSAQDFIEECLIKQWAVKALLVGEDFRFGHNRAGDIELLKRYQSLALLELFVMPEVKNNQLRISSTEVRRYLKQADFSKAAELLGRPYCITGKVMHGAKRGRLMNFPTANICLHHRHGSLHGVYAVYTKIDEAATLAGIANIGKRPTITQSSHSDWSLEVFLFSENDLDLYAKRISVECLVKVRDEKRFDSLDELKAQIQNDVAWVKDYLRVERSFNPP
jgi:riboflavin kinase/FMN adenylyltransferase